MYGAILLYNLCLAELTKNPSRQEEYRSELERWAGEIDQRMSDFETWNRTDFWNDCRWRRRSNFTAYEDFR